jgi:hypothetical protein
VLAARPRFGEALALRGALKLEAARGLQLLERGLQAKEAHQDFNEAFGLNRHLLSEWGAHDEQAQAL